jgi:hypothetical protein
VVRLGLCWCSCGINPWRVSHGGLGYVVRLGLCWCNCGVGPLFVSQGALGYVVRLGLCWGSCGVDPLCDNLRNASKDSCMNLFIACPVCGIVWTSCSSLEYGTFGANIFQHFRGQPGDKFPCPLLGAMMRFPIIAHHRLVVFTCPLTCRSTRQAVSPFVRT